MTAKLIGTLRGRQTEKGRTLANDRLIAVPVTAVNPAGFAQLRDLPRSCVEQLPHFFVSYNEMNAKRFSVKRRAGKARALALVKAAHI